MQHSHSFRQHHLLNLLQLYEQQDLPLDLLMSHYFRSHKSLGPKDRGEIAESVYGMMRWKGLLDHFCEKPPTWERRLEIFKQSPPEKLRAETGLSPHISVSFPKNLFDQLVHSHGLEKAIQLCLTCNVAAPTTVRANPLKTSREALLSQWKSKYSVSPCLFSKWGIIFHRKINFFGLPEFKQGLFEVQDEASQLIAQLVDAKPGQQVMDYCSGSGGKTLAFAHKMEGKGQIYLHDVRAYVLKEALKRLRRAGIQNAQVVGENDPKLKKLKKRMDWVLVDAPCSGTGTLRRNPDMKWKYSDDSLKRLIGQQRSIFEKALSYMKPNGRIIYATCSVLNAENQDQVAHFVKTYDLEVEGDLFQSLPQEGRMDGFFGAVFKMRDNPY